MAAEVDEDYQPQDDEPFMNERQRDYFRGKLLAWKEDIIKESKETIAHLQDENHVLPDLADPAYRGLSLSLLQSMQFQYTGWVRAQKIVPASILKAGANDVIILAGAGTSASAIRETQIQLKYLWDKSDYLLEPLK